MRFLLLALVVTGCAPPVVSQCGVELAGDGTLTEPELASAIRRALNGATFTTDPALQDPAANCKAMNGLVVRTRPTHKFLDEGEEVFGATRCWAREVIVGTPESGSWQFSALTHELFHVMQRCETPGAIDEGQDANHANWVRDGLLPAIERGLEVATCSGPLPVSCECVTHCSVSATGQVTTAGGVCEPRCWRRD